LDDGEEAILNAFAKCKDFEQAYRFIQKHPSIVSREFSDHLMARAFRAEYDRKTKEARLATKLSLCINYCIQMGPDGVGLFFKRYGGMKASTQMNSVLN
jgi:cell division cycle protein 37